MKQRALRCFLILAASLSLTLQLQSQPIPDEQDARINPQEQFERFKAYGFGNDNRIHDGLEPERDTKRQLPERIQRLFDRTVADQPVVFLPRHDTKQPTISAFPRSSGFPGHTLTAKDPCTEPVVAWMADYASGRLPVADYSLGVVADASGNIYVTGPSEHDYLTIKYDTSGTRQWIARYDGPAHDADLPQALAVDNSGNVYVTGFSYGAGTGADYATIKYDPSGTTLWIARHNGTSNASEIATAMVVDDSGNVYVTGYGHGARTVIATIKYDASGTQQWIAFLDDSESLHNYASAIGIDRGGNVYVTGWISSGASEDYITAKYSPSGVEEWVRRYDGPANGQDEAFAVGVDGSGNVYVAGTSYYSFTRTDFVIVKYDSSGTREWVARYNGPGNSDEMNPSMVVDDIGNVFLTGSSPGITSDYDFVTLKYNTSGEAEWVARYNGPGNTWDKAAAIAVDGTGNVYVTGIDGYGSEGFSGCTVVKYSPSGAELWIARNDTAENIYSRVITTDRSGSVCVTGYRFTTDTDNDFATIKYGASGEEQWRAFYDGPSNSQDIPTAIAVDAAGNVFTTGKSHVYATPDYMTMKHDSSGRIEWIVRYDGPGNSVDEPIAIAVDLGGNVYVTGWSITSGTNFDYATVKYNASGEEEWVARYNGPGNVRDVATAIAIDSIGNVYVTGTSGEMFSYDFATVKYNASGEEQWVARYDGPEHREDQSTGIALDRYGNVYVTGGSSTAFATGDYATIKYDPSGNEQWVAKYSRTQTSSDFAIGIAIDHNSNVVVTGCTDGLSSKNDFATVKYDPSGNEQWVAYYESPGNGDDNPSGIAIDAAGSVFVTGSSNHLSSQNDYATVKYDASGNEQWVARYEGPGNGDDFPSGITIDAAGNAFVTGVSYGESTGFDFATVKYNASGEEQWISRYDGAEKSGDMATAIAVDAVGDVYVTGSTGFADGDQYTTIKYGESIPRYNYLEQWNLVSLPRTRQDRSRTGVFPASTSSLYEYAGTYSQPESLRSGIGYWLKFPSTECVSIVGDTILIDTINIAAGWNLIGSITRPIAWSDVISDPPGMIVSQLFGFDGAYVPADTIYPGKAYWVNVGQPGKLILSSSPVLAPASANVRIVPTGDAPPPAPDAPAADKPAQSIPTIFALEQNYPNPFNPSTVIHYSLPVASYVTLRIYDVLGREVALLVDGMASPGERSAEWNASGVAGGIYFCRLDATDAADPAKTFVQTRKMILIH